MAFTSSSNMENMIEPLKAQSQPPCLVAVIGSYLLITKEHYSDGVSSIYEEIIKASSLEHAKEEAFIKVQERNVELSKDGRCFIVDVRSV